MATWVLPIYFNPLLLGIPLNRGNHEQIARNFFDYLSAGDNFADRVSRFLERHDRLRALADSLHAIPTDQRLREKLIFPLREAFGSFLTGNFLGTLALCGMIGEMLAIFQFEISDIQIHNRGMTSEDQKHLFGNQFEKLGQERRIEILLLYRVIDEDYAKHLEKIRKIRNNYLHYWSNDHEQVENDAYQVFCSTIEVVKKTFPQEAEDGKVRISEAVHQYLSRQGCFDARQNE